LNWEVKILKKFINKIIGVWKQPSHKIKPSPVVECMCEYPIWVYTSMIDGDLPWDKGVKTTFEYFKSKYTIHDSCWVGLFLDLNSENTVVIGIQWDSVWLPNEIAIGTSEVDEWPYLFIRIQGVEQISTWGYDTVKDIGRSLGNLEIESINDKQILAISDVFGGELQIVFSGDTHFVVLDKNKNLLSI
jgi:hypothetical protein